MITQVTIGVSKELSTGGVEEAEPLLNGKQILIKEARKRWDLESTSEPDMQALKYL